MAEKKRLAFVATGLPVILDSAEGFWAGAEALKNRPREADVLEGFVLEEAAKILILTDMLRCPKKQQSRQVSNSVQWFYSHLSRLLYACAISWRPMDKAQLRVYIDRERRSHEVDGPVGEFIMASGPVAERERRLYADVERSDDETLLWNAPRSWREGLEEIELLRRIPEALRLARAMRNLGIFTEQGLSIVAAVWGAEPLTDDMTFHDGNRLTMQTLKALEGKGLISEEATTDDASLLLSEWPLPMWDFDLKAIVVPLEDLEEERKRNLWRETGY